MTHTEAEKQFETWLADWKQLRATRQAETRLLLHTALSEGRTVLEVYGGSADTFSLFHVWPSCSPFVPGLANTADYLTEHLMKRHIGFGYTLVIDGVCRNP